MSGIPPFLEERVSASLNPDDAELVRTGWREAAGRPVTLRANTLRAGAADIEAALTGAGLPFERVGWYPDAFVMGEGVRERDLWELSVYQRGEVYLQSLSSMLPPLVMKPADRAEILDMCAAPGGKTSQMAALAPGAHICACELSAPRAERLDHNLAKLGATNVRVMRTDARKLDEFFSFDQVLLDAPCTGSGTFRAGDERAAGRITAKLLERVMRSQRALLDRALTVLKPGGSLIYSTCSVLPEENEEQVRSVLGMRRHRDCELAPVSLPAGAPGGPLAPRLLATDLEGALSIAPSRLFEGFFIVRITRSR
ncbi:MAG: RsmB/NOP family class I SAM-dependent RNA methyltransferase [Coriobacteriaceae bacterium]|nr:RsmB/NOP family class I SAM-dependent RNA methyltransferase [Coriobacteriaceae bacterium]